MSEQTGIVIIWTNTDREAALQMAFMYGHNSLARGWWENVRLLVWGGSARVLAEDEEIQAKLREMITDGVEVQVCRACADKLGVSDQLENLGFNVCYVGAELTTLLKSGWPCITV